MAIEIDPVCGMEVDTETSELKLEHGDRTYWFCGRGCLLEFRDDPDKYLDPGYRPSMSRSAPRRLGGGASRPAAQLRRS